MIIAIPPSAERTDSWKLKEKLSPPSGSATRFRSRRCKTCPTCPTKSRHPINVAFCTLCGQVRLRQRRRHGEEHANGKTERVEHPERLQTSMGRLDPAESREEGGGTVEGEGTLFYIHHSQTSDIIYPRVPACIQWREHDIDRDGGGGDSGGGGGEGRGERIIGITVEFYSNSRDS